MVKVVFVAREESYIPEIVSQLSEKETYGDTVSVIQKEDFDSDRYAGWLHILDVVPNKEYALIFDHSDTHQTLGFVTDIHHDELDSGKKTEKTKPKTKEVLPKECAKCHFLKPPKVSVCPSCGFKPSPQSEVEHVDGELQEVTRSDKQTKQRWYSMLLGYAQERRKSDGWIAHTYRHKFGVWPKGLADHAMTPDAEVAGYIRHRAIAYAKRMGKA